MLASCLLGSLGRADPFPEVDLKDFAQRYAYAVKTGDVVRIEKFFLPVVLKSDAESDKAAVERWETSFKAGLLPKTDPVWINVKSFDANPQVMESATWKARPEYQIEIQSHHAANGGEVGGPMLAEAVCKQGGTFYIVRPLPR